MPGLRVALVSGSPLVLAGLRDGLSLLVGFDVVYAGHSLDAARQAGFAHAEVAVVDGGAAGASFDGADVAEGPPLVLLADDSDRQLGEWLMSGVTVLARNASIDAIAAAASAAVAGLVATTPTMAKQALRFARVGARGSDTSALERLTAREHQVLTKMSLGLGNREIADALHISPHTAKFHVAQIIAKFDANSRAHAVAKALRAGLVEP